MLEGAVMEYVKWFIGLVSVAFICVMVIFMFRLNEVNSFQQEVNYQIERHGGLTDDAMVALNEHAKSVYGGCLADSTEDDAGCLFNEAANVKSSGFFVHEYTGDIESSGATYFERGSKQAKYGEQIRYVISRQIGTVKIGDESLLKPAVYGVSSSRVRGDID